MDIPKPMSKCCRWCCRTNVIVLIWVSVVLPFHKCLRLLRLGLYTVSTPRVNNDAGIVACIFCISLLRCNYYHGFLACGEEDFCEPYILPDTYYFCEQYFCYWLLSYSLTAIERWSQFWSMSHLVSENKSIKNNKFRFVTTQTMKFSIKDFLSKCEVRFTEDILNGKHHF